MLSCGCEPCFEGGYGDDGLSGRYSMEWCPLHKHAEALREAAKAISKYWVIREANSTTGLWRYPERVGEDIDDEVVAFLDAVAMVGGKDA